MKKDKSKEQQDFDYFQKIIIIGDSGVGKSNILLRYSKGQFVENYMMTIGLNYISKIVIADEIKIKLQIWDTAGQDKYRTITKNYYRKSDGVLIVFSINDRESFYSVKNWIEDLSQTIKDTTQIILVGNKIDLQQFRQVSKQQALQFANNYKIPLIQCSAKSGQSVQLVFNTLVKMIKQKIIDPKIQPQQTITKSMKLSTMVGKVHTKCCERSS